MYSFNSRIRYSEVDSEGVLTLESMIDYFQDCTTFHTQDGPATMEYLKKMGFAWILNSWHIVINRYPKLCERIIIGTVPYELKGFWGLRNFFMDTEDGERLAVANSVWTLFDFNKMVPTRVTDKIIEAYPLEERLPMEYGSRKIVIPEIGESMKCDDIEVKKHNLDTNNHVNNGQYVRMAIDSLGERKFEIKTMRAEYRKQAYLGDILHPIVIRAQKGDNSIYTVSLNDDKGEVVCIVELGSDT